MHVAQAVRGLQGSFTPSPRRQTNVPAAAQGTEINTRGSRCRPERYPSAAV